MASSRTDLERGENLVPPIGAVDSRIAPLTAADVENGVCAMLRGDIRVEVWKERGQRGLLMLGTSELGGEKRRKSLPRRKKLPFFLSFHSGMSHVMFVF